MALIPLLVGQTFPNYRALCSYLGEDVKSGNAKDTQLQVWKALFEWDRKGHSYVITKSCSVEQDLSMRKEDLKISKLKRAYMKISSDELSEESCQLEVDQLFPTYTSLCVYLKEPVLHGDSKKAQLERWKGFFEWETKGQSFKIVNVLAPWASIDESWRYSKIAAASKLLLNYFLENAQEISEQSSEPSSIKELIIVPKELYEVLGFHGEAWSLLKNDDAWDVPKDRLCFHKTVRDSIESAGMEVFRQEMAMILDTLDRKALLTIRRTYYVIDSLSKKLRVASVDEEDVLVTTKRASLLLLRDKLKDNTLTEYKVHQKGVAREFYGTWLALAQKYIKIEKFFPVVKLQASGYDSKGILKYLYKLEERESYKKESNGRLQPKVSKRASTLLERSRGRDNCEEDLSWLGELVPVVMNVERKEEKNYEEEKF